MKMKQLSDEHYIVVNESELGENVLVYNFYHNRIEKFSAGARSGLCWPITHSTELINESTQPNTEFYWNTVNKLSLSEVKELLGVVDVEKKAKYYYGQNRFTREYEDGFMLGFKLAYNQALEDNKEKKYTETDIKNAIIRAYSMMGNTIDVGYFNEVIQSLQPQTEWEVEIVDGKLKLKS